MNMKIASASKRFCLLAIIGVVGSYTAIAQDASRGSDREDIVGTWYLALDSEPFGLPPGLPLSGLAQFHQGGTFQTLDAGDFGQATFTNTQNSQQFGTWVRDPAGAYRTTSLFLDADLLTGEVLRWQRIQFVLGRGSNRDELMGTVNIAVLACDNLLPIPTPLTCPDPIASADDFVPIPPADIPLTLRRLRAR